jgi:predicted ArsR family transcriptional regulator
MTSRPWRPRPIDPGGFLTRGFSQKTGNLAGLTRQTDAELLRLLFENGMMHTTELAAALGLAVDETCSRMDRLQRLGVVEYTPMPQNPRDQN